MKTICPNNFDYVDSQFPCDRLVCTCHENYKNRLKHNQEKRRTAKEKKNAIRQSA